MINNRYCKIIIVNGKINRIITIYSINNKIIIFFHGLLHNNNKHNYINNKNLYFNSTNK